MMSEEQTLDDGEPISEWDGYQAEPEVHYSSELDDPDATEDLAPTEELAELPDSSDFQAAIPSRMAALTAAIEHHPDAPSNYVLRGELLLEDNYYREAAADFEKGLEIADSLAETANWGYIYRGLADRAREGLRRCPSFD